MHEYEVNIWEGRDSFALSVRPLGSTGSAPYRAFKSWRELREFFQDQELSEDMLRQLDSMASQLRPGRMYKERMFLPEVLDQRLMEVSAIAA